MAVYSHYRTQLIYAVEVWSPALEKFYNIKSLNNLYRLVLLSTTGAIKTIPTLVIGALVGLEPLIRLNNTVAKILVTQLSLVVAWIWETEYGHSFISRKEVN